MSSNHQLERLESAIFKRAQELANSHRQDGQQHREKIFVETAKRLNALEERELTAAHIAAEQAYRRRVQASEIKMQAELDQLRWNLVQSVMQQLRERLQHLTTEKSLYLSLLKQYLRDAVSKFPEEELVIEVTATDYTWLYPQWTALSAELLPKRCTLVSSPNSHSLGGLLVHTVENRTRLDDTFEGLLERLANELYQVIIAQLFASASPLRNL